MADYNSDRTGSNIDFTLDKVDVRDTVIDIGSNTTNRITVNSAGDVGIGTASPTATLDVRGSAYFISTGGTRTTDTPNGNGVEVIGGTINNILSYNRTNATYLPIRYRAGVQSWEVNNTERMRIDREGNVGIGTASPSAKLDVVGDINVSGGVYLGGTGAANKLDDYEEGTFTATIKGDTAEPTTLIELTSQYTKVGRIVHFQIGFENIDTTGYSGAISVIGLPFTNRYSRATANVLHYKTTSWTTSQTPVAFIGGNETKIAFLNQDSSSAWAVNQHDSGTGRYLWISGTYTTDS